MVGLKVQREAGTEVGRPESVKLIKQSWLPLAAAWAVPPPLFFCLCRLGFPDLEQGSSACLRGHCVLDGIRRASGSLVINTHGDHLRFHSSAI